MNAPTKTLRSAKPRAKHRTLRTIAHPHGWSRIPVLAALMVTVMLAWGVAWMLTAPSAQAAERFPRRLEDIRVFGQGETIEFAFSQPYQGRPAIDYKPGRFALSFSGTGSTKPVRALKPMDESIYQGIKVVQNRYSTTVSFDLKDRNASLKDRLNLSGSGNVLKLQVDAPVTAPVPSPEAQKGEALLRQMEKRIAGEPPAAPGQGVSAASRNEGEGGAPLTMGDMTGGEFFNSLVAMVISLAVIIASLYGVLYLYNRFVATRLRRFAGNHSIRQVASFHIGPRQRIVVLDINGESVACGVTPTQITYLTHLNGKGAVGLTAVKGGAGTPPANMAGGGSDVPAAGVAEGSDPVKADPVHQFAEVLKQRVRSLKRIN